MIIDGYVKDKNGNVISDAMIEIKRDDFITIYSTKSDSNGYYKFDIPQGKYPFMIAVKNYVTKYLEFWCHNIALLQNLSLDISFDTLEVYGINAFSVKGGLGKTMIYFRPMSLEKYHQGKIDLVPDNINIKAFVDDKEVPIININKIKEIDDNIEMTSFLVQIAYYDWKKISIKITDEHNNYGEGVIFNN